MLRVLMLAGLLWFGIVGDYALAVQPDEMLADPALEARARALSLDLRCLVCQNQSIDDSNAPLARDLRLLVRERLKAGDSDDSVIAYLTDRFGDFVRLKPPFQSNTWLLWLVPPALLLSGGLGVAAYLRNRRQPAAAPLLTAEEEAKLSRLLGDKG
ncbi:MAG: cytochrome c-type biogenesis protein [Rhodospirillaceae bacterium]